MDKPIIEVKNLTKQYNIGSKQGYVALRDVLVNIAKAPFKWFKSKNDKSVKSDNGLFNALEKISFTVEKGDIIGVIGRNGAGKSTLLKVLSQITPPTEGEVILRGRVGSLLEVGTGFHPELSGRENIFLNGAILGMKKKEIEDKFDEIVEFAGVDKFLDTPVKRYSSGMHVRLAFSVAAHLDPEILIVDEVLAVGDAEFQKKCLGKMDQLTNEAGRTVLFVSHNMEAIKKLCTKCILLDKGKIICMGDTPSVLNTYNNIQSEGKISLNKGEYNKNRRGSGTLSFTHIDIVDSDNKERNTFTSGETVKFKISYKVYEEMKGLHVNVCFFSHKARNVLLTDARYQVKSNMCRKDEEGNFIVEFKLDSIRPGEYVLYFWLGDSAAVKEGIPTNYDVLEDIVGPLIVKSPEDKDTTGIFSLPSKIICS